MKAIAMLVACCLASSCGVVEGVAAFYGFAFGKVTPDALDKQLAPFDRWFVPEGEGQQAGVLLVPGCAGTQPFHRGWAEFLRNRGFVVLIIDSFASRGITSEDALEGACEGEHTWGFERAGDVLISLQRLRKHERVNPQQLHIIGWSHGGWSVMDAVLFASANKSPPFLTELPKESLRGVRDAVALYPYCGFGSLINELNWPTTDLAGWVVLAKYDKNIEPEPCAEAIVGQIVLGRGISYMVYHVDHWFDNPRGFHLVPHRYDAKVTRLVQNEVVQRFSIR